MIKVSDNLKMKIILEIGRLSKNIFDNIHPDQNISGAYVINHLAGILADMLTISDFHDHISSANEEVRKYYYELLFEEL